MRSIKYRQRLKITPLSQWGKTPEPVAFRPDPAVDMKTPPKLQVDRMPASQFFAYAAELLKLQPPHLTDEPIIVQMKKIGIEPGKNFDIGKVDPAIQRGLDSAPHDAQKLMAWELATIARVANGWSMNTDTMGVYGNYYLKRVIVTQLGREQTFPRTLSTRSTYSTVGANLWTERTSTRSTSIRVPLLPLMPSGRSRSTTKTVSKWQII